MNKTKIVFGIANYDERNNELEMPPKNAAEKYIEEQKDNMIEIVVHENNRQILNKLEEAKKER